MVDTPLSGLVDRAGEFVSSYGKKGFLRKMFSANWDATTIKQLDVDLTACVGDISMTLNVAQMRMQQRTFEEVERLAGVVETQKTAGGTLSEEAVQQVMAAAGCSQEDASEELGAISADIKALLEGQQVLQDGQDTLMAGQVLLAGGQDQLMATNQAILDQDKKLEQEMRWGVNPKSTTI